MIIIRRHVRGAGMGGTNPFRRSRVKVVIVVCLKVTAKHANPY
jgi:hypothetical protein